MSSAEELFYGRGELSVDQVQGEIDEFWQEFDARTDSMLDSELRTDGIDPAGLADVDRKTAITVHAGASGVDPTVVLIVVTLAPSANHIVKDLWKTVLLPRIRRRWGDDAIGDEKRSRG
jgi:hypothetical protein